MTLLQIGLIAVAFVIAGVAKGAIGMGMPPIAIGLMSFAVPLESAIAIMVVPTMITNIWQAIYGGGIRPLLRRFGTMAATATIGILGVGLLLSDLGSPQTAGWVGVLLVLYSIIALTPWRPRVPRRVEPWANPVIGLASGAVAGSTGVAAVPFLPYMQSLDMNPHELVQSLGIMFLFITGMLAVSLALHGAYHLANSVASVAAVAPTMAGVWLGQRARRRLKPETFRRIFILGMLGIGLHLARGLL
ncbi:MAG TPA: sulfite exporter TauE/SafE family protein [Reyranella sp.]|nr:sulfite exporter TauE/SafE family protein [Reyranella sp.]